MPITILNKEDLDRAGMKQFDMESLLRLSVGSTRFDGEKTAGTNAQQINLRGIGGAVTDGLIIRGSLGVSHNGTNFEDVDQTTNLFQGVARVEVLKSVDIGTNTVYGKAAVGGILSQEKNEFESNTVEVDRTGFTWSVGAEYPHLIGNTEVALVSDIIYESQKLNFDDGDEVTGGVRVGCGLIAYYQNDLDLFHTKNGSTYSEGKFNKGKLVFDGNAGLDVFFGKQTQTIEIAGDEVEAEASVSFMSLMGYGGYYFADQLAALGGLRYTRDAFNNSDADFAESESRFQFKFGARAHLSLLGAENLRNLYVESMLGVGSEGRSSEFAGSDTNDSEGNLSFDINVGGDHFISPSVALFGKIGYSSYSVGDFGEGGLNLRSGLHYYPSCAHGQEAE